MSLSEAGICNVALATLGQQPIRSLSDEDVRASLCNALYYPSVLFCLAQADWPFARRIVALSELSEDSQATEGYYSYQLPSDCVVPLTLYPDIQGNHWEVFGTSLITKIADGVTLRYTTSVAPVTTFSATFATSVAEYLAYKLAGPLTGAKASYKKELFDEFRSGLVNNAMLDANIGEEERLYSDDHDNDSFVTGIKI